MTIILLAVLSIIISVVIAVALKKMSPESTIAPTQGPIIK
jgi:hypothetical protein